MTDRIIQYHSSRFNSEINSDVSMLNDKEKSLVKLSMNKEWTNPKYKLKWFVGQAQITPFAKFRQWLLEIKSKEESIENMEYEIAKLDVEYDRYKRMRDQSSDPLDKRLAEIEMWNTDRLRYTSKRRLQDWYLERQHLIDLLHEFMESEESKLPDGSGRTYMDIIDTEEEDVYEYEYWTNRLAKQAACDMLFYGRINSGNMDAILSMSPEQQAETLALTVNFSTQLQQYQLKLQSDAESALKNKLEMDNKALLTPSEVKYIEENMPLYDKSIKNADQEEMLNVYTIRNDSQ
jgi:hypothetical protein